MRHCPACGNSVLTEAPEKKSCLQCPRCETNLAEVTVGKHLLHECAQCGGLWVDKNSFQDICIHEEEQEGVLNFRSEMEMQPDTQPHKPGRAYIPCPQCGRLMNHKNFSGRSGIVLDWCRDHGSWFDRRELQQIVTFIRNGGLRKAREQERLNIQEQQNRLRMQQLEMAILGNRLDTSSGGVSDFRNSGDPLLQFLYHTFLR